MRPFLDLLSLLSVLPRQTHPPLPPGPPAKMSEASPPEKKNARKRGATESAEELETSSGSKRSGRGAIAAKRTSKNLEVEGEASAPSSPSPKPQDGHKETMEVDNANDTSTTSEPTSKATESSTTQAKLVAASLPRPRSARQILAESLPSPALESPSSSPSKSQPTHYSSQSSSQGLRYPKRDDLRAKLKEANRLVSELTTQNDRLNATISKLRADIKDLRATRPPPTLKESPKTPMKVILEKLRNAENVLSSTRPSADDIMKAEDTMFKWCGERKARELVQEVGQIDGHHPSGKRGVHSRQDWHYIWLIMSRYGLTLVDLAEWCEMEMKEVAKQIQAAQKSWLKWAQKQIKLPTIAEWQRRSPQSLREACEDELYFFVDSTYIPILPPTNGEVQKHAWHPKHKVHALVFTAVVTGDGHIVWISEVDLGNMHDATAWNSSGVVPKLTKAFGEVASAKEKTVTTPQLCICGDKAYDTINIPTGWDCVVTLSGAIEDVEDGYGRQIMQEDDFESTGTDDDSQVRTDSDTVDDDSDDEEEIASITRRSAKKTAPRAKKTTKRTVAASNGTYGARTGEKRGELPRRPTRSDASYAKWRSVIERTFAKIKRWRILHSRVSMSRSTENTGEMVTIFAALANKMIDDKLELDTNEETDEI